MLEAVLLPCLCAVEATSQSSIVVASCSTSPVCGGIESQYLDSESAAEAVCGAMQCNRSTSFIASRDQNEVPSSCRSVAVPEGLGCWWFLISFILSEVCRLQVSDCQFEIEGLWLDFLPH